jgi:hypothetical protein
MEGGGVSGCVTDVDIETQPQPCIVHSFVHISSCSIHLAACIVALESLACRREGQQQHPYTPDCFKVRLGARPKVTSCQFLRMKIHVWLKVITFELDARWSEPWTASYVNDLVAGHLTRHVFEV